MNLLVLGFREKAQLLLENCAELGATLRPFFTLRGVEEQAKLWRQSRPLSEIEATITKLRNEGAQFIADTLGDVGPQHGRWATNALPGQSWHQWGEAIDCFVVGENGRAAWSSKHPSYEIYASEARKLGLNSGYYWQRQDAVHVQLRAQGVRAIYTWPEIDRTMKEKFG